MSENPFWSFMVDHYSDPQVEKCCLLLQDDHDAKVVFLLWLVWLDGKELTISKKLFSEALELAQHVESQYTQSIRHLRDKLKLDGGFEAEQQKRLRKSMLELELNIERVVADQLFELSEKKSEQLRPASSSPSFENLSFYLEGIGLKAQREVITCLAQRQ